MHASAKFEGRAKKQYSLRVRISEYALYLSAYMSWFVASDQFRKLSLLWRRHKVKASSHCTDEAQNKAETYVCSYLAPCKNPPFHY